MMADSGTSLNMIPSTDYFKIFNHFIRDKFECHILPNTLHGCECTEEQQLAMPDIHFKVEGDDYIINRNQWFERASNGICVVKFMHAPRRQQWILGINFFANYYTCFDYENHRLGFAKSVNFHKDSTSKSFINWAAGLDKPMTKEMFKKMVSNIHPEERKQGDHTSLIEHIKGYKAHGFSHNITPKLILIQ